MSRASLCSLFSARLWEAHRGRPILAVVALLILCSGVAAPGAEGKLKKAMNAAEFEAAGLAKLSPEELASLEDWILTSRWPPEAMLQ